MAGKTSSDGGKSKASGASSDSKETYTLGTAVPAYSEADQLVEFIRLRFRH